MSALSNLFRPRDVSPPVFRPAQRDEIEPAVRLIVGGPRGRATDEQVLDFLSFSVDRGIDVSATWIAEIGGRMVWTLLPIVSPGRTMLIFTPSRLPPRQHLTAVSGLAQAMDSHFAQRGVILSQMLIDPRESGVIQTYCAGGYERLAELLYLQACIRGNEPLPLLPGGWQMLTHSDSTAKAFSSTVAASYEGSLDCPRLNGVRTIDDVMAGHRAAGDFDPNLWFLLTNGRDALGTVLLSRSAGNTSIELVYIGVTPSARRQGVGRCLVRWALAVTALENRRYLSLAVDSGNEPALQLYYENGLSRIGSRVALVRDLRPLLSASPTRESLAVS